MRLELPGRYHTANLQLSRIGNSGRKNVERGGTEVLPQHGLSRMAAVDFIGLEIAQGGAQERRTDATTHRALHQITDSVLALNGPAILDVDQY